MRTRTLVLLAIVLTVLPVWLAGLVHGGGAPPPVRAAVATPRVPSAATRALTLLHRWDRRRAAAWRRGDPATLARLYVAGSRTGRRDVAHLERWRRRRLRVAGLRQQVAVVRIADQGAGRLVLVVTDRTVDGIAVGHRRRIAVPQSPWATHRIILRRVHGRWRVAEVSVARRVPTRGPP
jgi:hypothetical protein